MKQIALLLISILILAIPATAIGMSVPFKGDITLDPNISATVQAVFSDTTITSSETFDIERGGTNVGRVQIQLRLSDSVGGDFSFQGDAQGSVNIALDSVNDTVTYSGLTFHTSSSVTGWTPIGGGVGKTFSFDLVQEGEVKGRMIVGVVYSDIPFSQATTDNVFVLGNFAGTIFLSNTLNPAIDELQSVTNYFAGFITRGDGSAVSASTLVVLSSAGEHRAQIMRIGSKTAYGLNQSPLVVTGFLGTPAFFVIDDKIIKNITLATTTDVRRVDLNVDQLPGPNFPDDDRDGVPNSADSCPNSLDSRVDSSGCTCAQLLAQNPLFVCTFGFDTGPDVQLPTPQTCETNDTCVSNGPLYCNENKSLVADCGRCGCPEGFTCAQNDELCPEGQECVNDGSCYKIIESVGVKCMKNDYKMGPGLDCATISNTSYDFFANDDLGRNMLSFVNVHVDAGAFGGKKEVKKQVSKKIAANNICIETEDYGCVSDNFKCPGEQTLLQSKDEVANAFSSEVQTVFSPKKTSSGVEKAFKQFGAIAVGPALALCFIPPLCIAVAALGALFSDVDISFSFNSAQLDEVSPRITYPCDNILLNSSQVCTPTITNGEPESKIDLLFIGAGFTNQSEFNTTVSRLIDFRGNQSGKMDEGLFSREPFKLKKSQFNIWVATAPNMTFENHPTRPGAGKIPKLSDVSKYMLACPQQDFVFVVSNESFQSDCALESSQPCYLSLHEEPNPGRQLLRLAGKRIAKLSDEFLFEIDSVDSPDRVGEFDFIGKIADNCRPNLQDARAEYRRFRTQGKILGFYDGCGGICDERCREYVRGTLNSVLNLYNKRCLGTDNTSCRTGPPFDPFYIINENSLVRELENFGETPPEEDTTPSDEEDVPLDT
ncbi:hypothetical protein J4219_05770 [Candidatus Woesearchaeota archaeon]|nr:hypothetical protein [Candidatus Woesearchaeota archaeon]